MFAARPLLVMFVMVHLAIAVHLAPAAEPTDPRRPPAITTENVPVVPAAIFQRLHQYQNIRAAGFASWAPDGEGMLIQTRFGNTVQLHQVYEPGGRREQVTFFDEPASGQFLPAARDGSLLVTMSVGGSENDQIWLVDRSAYRTTRLTDGTSRNLLGPVRRDGELMVVHSNQRNGRDTDLYLQGCHAESQPERIFETKNESWSARDWSPDGKTLLLVRYVSINESYPALFQIADRRLEPIALPTTDPCAVGAAAFSADGLSLWMTCDAAGEYLNLYHLDLGTSVWTNLTADLAWDVRNLAVNPENGLVAFTTNEDGASRLYLQDDDRRMPVELPLGVVGGLEFSPDGTRLGFTLSRPHVPADAYSLDVADLGVVSDSLTRWTYSEIGGLAPGSFVEPTAVRFKSFDDRMIPAYVFRPRDSVSGRVAEAEQPAPRRPVLIAIHGGPESQYRPDFSSLTQLWVNELGLCVIHPNVRGSAGYGKTYLKLDNGPLREDSVRDIGALLDWIATQPDLDPGRVGVTGASYGGYMVLASLAHFGDRIRAGIDNVGIANFITFLERTSPYRQDLRRAEYGDERDPAMRQVFERINPTARADRITSALLVEHGRNDPRVPFSEAQQIAERVRSQGRTVWTVYADNEGHGFTKKENRDYQAAVEVLFLEQNLLGTAPRN